MKCPHCLVEFYDDPRYEFIGEDQEGRWGLVYRVCPSCGKLVIELVSGDWNSTELGYRLGKIGRRILVRPKGPSRSPVPPEVPGEFSEDYTEACLVIADSPKASAALSRRCLQHILIEKTGTKSGNLANEIEQAISSGKLPSHLTESLDAIRNIGNFAAHPMKSTKSGEIVPVEHGEAEWNLDVIEALFDFLFVQPEMTKKKRAALDQKLKDAGKRPMK
jgi:hypothetical protein